MQLLRFSRRSATVSRLLTSWLLIISLLIISLLLPGCRRSDELFRCEAATKSVEAALAAWRQRLVAEAAVIHQGEVELHDEDAQQGAQLISGSVVRSYIDPDQTVRCVARLVIKQADGRQQTKEITYQVVVRDGKTIIAPDPFS